MSKKLAALFACVIGTKHDVAALEEGTKSPATLAMKAVSGLFEKHEDEATAVYETADGWLITGAKNGFLMADDGSVTHKALPADMAVAVEEDMHPLHGAIKGHLAALKTAIDSKDHAKAKEIHGKLTAAISAPAKKVTLKPKNESALDFNALFRASLAIAAPKAKPEKIAEATEAAFAAAAGILAESGKTEGLVEAINEVSMAPSYGYDTNSNRFKVGDVTVEVYGGSVRIPVDQMIKDAPSYSIGDFVLEKAVREVMESEAGESFIAAVQAALKDSDKIAPLEIILRESINEDAADEVTITEGDDYAKIVMGEAAVELRAGKDGKGEVLATVECDVTDQAAVTEAEAAIVDKATELGFALIEAKKGDKAKDKDDAEDDEEETDDEGEDDEDDEEMDEATSALLSAAVVGIVVEHKGDYAMAVTAFDEAVESKDRKRAVMAATMVAEAAGVELPAEVTEGLHARRHKSGRRPSGKTLIRKAMVRVKGGKSGGFSAAPYKGHPAQTNPATSRGNANDVTKSHVNPTPGKPKGSKLGENTATNSMKNERPGKLASTSTDPADPTGGIPNNVDFTDQEAQDTWTESVRKMSPEEFVGDMLEHSVSDDRATFALRVKCIVEAFKKGPGKKDMARKITAANPIIKKKTGKGVSMEEVVQEAAAETVTVEFPRSRIEEFTTASQAAKLPDATDVVVLSETVLVKVPKGAVGKLLTLFTGDDIKIKDSAPAA